MSESMLKVEIKLVDGDWQWLGKLSPDMLKLLCEIADLMNDINYEKPKGEL